MSSTSRVAVLVGRGRYEDPWHDHAAVAHVAALLLHSLGHEVRLTSLMPGALSSAVQAGPDLVVVVAGTGRTDPDFDGTDDDWAPDHAALTRWADAGGSLLGVHSAANTFTDSPHWERLLGGRWVPGTSWHPDVDPSAEARFTPVAGHPVADAVASAVDDGAVTAHDERYCGLAVGAGSSPLLTHAERGREEVAAWAVEERTAGGGARRAVYDGLGHSVASFASASRVTQFAAEVSWLLARP